MLSGKHIILGITGGIAAYKIPELIRRLRQQGADVRVVMTEAASHFITPLTLQAISGHPVAESLFDPSAESSMGHIELAKWADLVVIAPATADILARLAHGFANDLLTTLCLATHAPIAVVPAMNQQMYRASITQQNITLLQQRGVTIWGPAQGEQACGDVGPGRMWQPEQIAEAICHRLTLTRRYAGYRLLITAGPTVEAIDPVRFITNHSSGHMGFALAQMAAQQGAIVTLITGPVTLPTPANVHRIDVTSAMEMYQHVMLHAKEADIFISNAAVSDYRSQCIASEKIKKSDETITLTLVKNPDIVASVAAMQEHRPFVVGFAAETHSLEAYAKDKLLRKNLDLICANNVANRQQGFGNHQNALQLFWRQGECQLPLSDKLQLSQQLLEKIMDRYHAKN